MLIIFLFPEFPLIRKHYRYVFMFLNNIHRKGGANQKGYWNRQYQNLEFSFKNMNQTLQMKIDSKI